MPLTDTRVVDSPGWWLVRLANRLANHQRPYVDRMHRMLVGQHDLPDPFDTDDDAESFRSFLESARSNYLSLVVEAVVERMRATDFRTAADDITGDDDTAELFRAAHLDADQALIWRSMLAYGRAYVMVGEHPRKAGTPLITIEDPRSVITESYIDDRRELRAGLKVFADVDGRLRATLFLRDADGGLVRVIRYRAPRNPDALTTDDTASLIGALSERSLQHWDVFDDTYSAFDAIPIVPFLNRQDAAGNAMSEFEDVIPNQNRINTTLLHRLVAEKYGAFRQLAILNMNLPKDPVTGEPVAPDLVKHPSAAWLLEGDKLGIWESQQTSTADILKGIEADIRDLAATTRTPPHYLLSGIVNASGDALKAAETGLVSKVRERIAQAGEALAMVMRLAHRVVGNDERAADDSTLEVVWADPESRSLAEVSDAVVKQMSAGKPWRSRMALLGHTETEIDRMEIERTQDAMLASLMAPPAPTPPTGLPGPAAAPTAVPEPVPDDDTATP